MVISIYVFGFWGLHPETPTRALLLAGCTGGLLSPVPLFCPPPKQISDYAPEFGLLILIRMNYPILIVYAAPPSIVET